MLLIGTAAVIAVAGSGGRGAATGTAASAGALAPDGDFATTNGGTRTVAALRGRPTLLWFVTTWCSSCQAGTQAMAQQISALAAHRVRVVELELADDLGQPGPAISDFGRQLAGADYHNPDWTFGTASTGLTQAYDPAGYLDVYYLLDASGHIAYVNGNPGATMPQLLRAAAKMSSRA